VSLAGVWPLHDTRTGHWIESERLLLRRITRDDYDFFARLHATPEVLRYIMNGQPRSAEESRVWVDRAATYQAGAGPAAHRIFELCAAGWGFRRIASALNAERALAPKPRRSERPRSWAPSSVREIVHRDLYRGLIVWNRRRKRDVLGRKKPALRPESEWVRVPAPQLRIVDDDLWRAAHTRLDTGRSVYLARTNGQAWGRPVNGVTSPYLLTGFTRCARCGGGLITRTRGGAGRQRWHTYVCGSWHYRGGTVCGNRLEAIRVKADVAVLAAIEQALFRGDIVELTIQEALALWQPAQDARDEQREALLCELRRLDAEVARLTQAVAGGGEELAPLVAALREREGRRRDVRARLAAGEAPAPSVGTRRDVERRLRTRLTGWQGVLRRQTAEARPLLDRLLEGRLTFTPHEEQRLYTFSGRATLGGLISGAVPSLAMVTPAGDATGSETAR
jgi:site-specific DNA recombinase